MPLLKEISGNILDVLNKKIYQGTLKINKGKITDIVRKKSTDNVFILPGFIDSHVHIESSMLTPSAFARVAVIHGTVAAVSDPHEIANVLGIEGIKYMLKDALNVPFKFYFGAPSCVPASCFETNGAIVDVNDIEELMKLDNIKYLSEVMNFPGVINNDPDIYKKILIAKKYSKPIDGHAPGLTGSRLEKYIKTGISTDHESCDMANALEKIAFGMKIQIREGSAVRNFNELIPLVDKHAPNCMFCTDDLHPDDLKKGHINKLVKRALDKGRKLMDVLTPACINPVLHYNLDVGLLQKGDNADFIVIDNLENFNIKKVFINGELVCENGLSMIKDIVPAIINNFNIKKRVVSDFKFPYKSGNINVIKAMDSQIITEKLLIKPEIVNKEVISDIKRDILKIAIVNRYNEACVSLGFINNFGLKKGAIASSVAHDSHNIVAVGADDKSLCRAVNLIIENRGGLSVVSEKESMVLALPVAGLMSDSNYIDVSDKYIAIQNMVRSLGSSLKAPFMTLSFMALLVIPKIKISDLGLFDVEEFKFIDNFV